MSDKSIKHFIWVQFFNWQNPKYPYDVLDVNFLSTQLPLAKNILRSLENQTNKNFELCFYVNDKVFNNAKYDFIFSTLRDSTALPIKFIKASERARLIREAFNEYDFVIQTRMDFDDFVYKDAVEDAQNKINECDDLLVYGYCQGYKYLYGELYIHRNLWRGIGHHSVFQSLILKSSFAKNIGDFCLANFYHDKFIAMLKEYLEKKNVEYAGRMFKQDTTTNAYIYFRHEFSQDQWRFFNTGQFKIPEQKPLTTADITKEQLKTEYGFDGYELKSIE